MHKTLLSIGLGVVLFSCASQKKTSLEPKPAKPQPGMLTDKAKTQETMVDRPAVERHGGHAFYRVNIADASKNNNTISYGSIVGANPQGYQVVKTYFPSVGQNFRQRYVILHYTALDNEKSIRVLTQQSLSAHYLVNDLDDKEIYQLVDENKRAYHAGVSSWRKVENLNDSSIGIEIVNTGYTADAQGNKTFYDYPEWQYRKVAALVKDLVDRYQIAPINVLGHSDIAPTRKEDPGPKFPWKRLYEEYGLGMWYEESAKLRYLEQMDDSTFSQQVDTPPFIFQYQTMLRDFGYGLLPNGAADRVSKKTVEAFQYRFRPERCDGVMDMETYAILQALLEKYPAK